MFLKGLVYPLAIIPFLATASEYSADSADSLTVALRKVVDGDVISLLPGTYEGNFVISKSITIKGTDGVIFDALGKGSCITVKAKDVKIFDLELKKFGSDLYKLDSGVLISEGSKEIELKNLRIRGPGFGIRADKSDRIHIEDCDIRGEKRRYVLDRGDGVYFNYVRDSGLKNNRVLYTRDGFYFENTDNTVSSGNYFAGLQYGIHYMYTRGDRAFDNDTEACIGGYALMSSERIMLSGNKSKRTVEFGVLLNETNESLVKDNRVQTVKNPRGKASLDTEGKGIFIYGGGKNQVESNQFFNCDIGVSMAMGGEGTTLARNSFADNRIQVRYIGSKFIEWKQNYWNTYQGWDLNQDGFGDNPYRPNDSLDRLFWMYPDTRFLMNSPVVLFLRFVSEKLELDRGTGIVDSQPLMKPPTSEMRKTS